MLVALHQRVATAPSLECEGCDRRFAGHATEGYADIWIRAEAEGWEIRRVSCQWVHLCGCCASPGND